MQYKTLQSHAQKKQCILLTTEKEYNEQKCILAERCLVKIRSVCGHDNIVRSDLFCYQDNGIHCKECVQHIISTNASKIKSLCIEQEGYAYVKALFEPHVDIVKMVEGTKADFAIRYGTRDNLWVPVQLKVTSKPKENRSMQYWFTIQHKYDMPILCVCIKDKRLWFFPENVLDKMSLQIGFTRSKYSAYEVVSDRIQEHVRHVYDASAKYSIDVLNTPVSRSQQQEQMYRKRREKYFSNTQFQYPEQNGLPYDFIVNGKRFQEKVLCKHPRLCGYICTFGKRKNRNTIIQYCKNDADYYWFHIPNENTYYIIPENVLIEQGFVNDSFDFKTARSITFYPMTTNGNNNKGWQDNYKYRYDENTENVLRF